MILNLSKMIINRTSNIKKRGKGLGDTLIKKLAVSFLVDDNVLRFIVHMVTVTIQKVTELYTLNE